MKSPQPLVRSPGHSSPLSFPALKRLQILLSGDPLSERPRISRKPFLVLLEIICGHFQKPIWGTLSLSRLPVAFVHQHCSQKLVAATPEKPQQVIGMLLESLKGLQSIRNGSLITQRVAKLGPVGRHKQLTVYHNGVTKGKLTKREGQKKSCIFSSHLSSLPLPPDMEGERVDSSVAALAVCAAAVHWGPAIVLLENIDLKVKGFQQLLLLGEAWTNSSVVYVPEKVMHSIAEEKKRWEHNEFHCRNGRIFSGRLATDVGTSPRFRGFFPIFSSLVICSCCQPFYLSLPSSSLYDFKIKVCEVSPVGFL